MRYAKIVSQSDTLNTHPRLNLARLTHAEFEREATWATRKFVPFVMQRISVAVQIAAATEIRQALGRGMGPDSA